MRYGQVEKELYGGETMTTNNRMELKAAIEGLAALKTRLPGSINNGFPVCQTGDYPVVT